MKKVFLLINLLVCCTVLCSCFSMITKTKIAAKEQSKPSLDESESPQPYTDETQTPSVEEQIVYFENFDVTLPEGEYEAPAAISFTGTENGIVYYAFSDGELSTDSTPTGILWDGNDIALPAGTFTLRAMCVDEEGNSKTILRSYAVNRTYSLINYEDVAQNGYFDYVVIRDRRDKVYVFDRFTGELEEVKKFPEVNAINHIVAESSIRSTRDEMGAEMYDKIIETAPAGAVQSIKTEVVKDELYVFVKNYDALEGIHYSYIDGIASGEEEEYAIFFPQKSDYYIPEEYATISTDIGELNTSAIIGNYVFCIDTDNDKAYVHDMNTGETAEDVFRAERWTTFLGTTSNAVYYKFPENGEYNCKRVDYDEIGSIFFGR